MGTVTPADTARHLRLRAAAETARGLNREQRLCERIQADGEPL